MRIDLALDNTLMIYRLQEKEKPRTHMTAERTPTSKINVKIDITP